MGTIGRAYLLAVSGLLHSRSRNPYERDVGVGLGVQLAISAVGPRKGRKNS